MFISRSKYLLLFLLLSAFIDRSTFEFYIYFRQYWFFFLQFYLLFSSAWTCRVISLYDHSHRAIQRRTACQEATHPGKFWCCQGTFAETTGLGGESFRIILNQAYNTILTLSPQPFIVFDFSFNFFANLVPHISYPHFAYENWTHFRLYSFGK